MKRSVRIGLSELIRLEKWMSLILGGMRQDRFVERERIRGQTLSVRHIGSSIIDTQRGTSFFEGDGDPNAFLQIRVRDVPVYV